MKYHPASSKCDLPVLLAMALAEGVLVALVIYCVVKML
jgi:hypothetical protein